MTFFFATTVLAWSPAPEENSVMRCPLVMRSEKPSTTRS